MHPCLLKFSVVLNEISPGPPLVIILFNVVYSLPPFSPPASSVVAMVRQLQEIKIAAATTTTAASVGARPQKVTVAGQATVKELHEMITN